MRSYLFKLNYYLFAIALFGAPFFFTSPVSATYTASLSANDSVTLNASAMGSGVSVQDESLTVTTNCNAGYNLSLSTTTDGTLYLNGDSANESSTINTINGSYALSDLSHNANTWGYSLTGNTSSAGAFNPLSTTPSLIKTTSETASETDIEDTFSIYYGTAINMDLDSGNYTLGNDGTISYYLTVAPSCTDSAVITFNENLDGQGAEGTDITITNFPTTSDNTTDTTNNTITLSNKRPTRTGYIFKEWNTEADGTGDYYYVGETVPMGEDGLSGFVTLYAIWVTNCPADTICYNANHADGGTMTNQSATSNANNVLTSSNFDRSGYGFAGWNTEADGTGTNYGPNQTINPGNISTTGLTLFAHWLKPSGSLQTWANASSMNTGDVIALKDNRDNEVYAVAKLADGNIWTIENLRLNPGTAHITVGNTNNPTSAFIADAPSTTPTSSQCSSDSVACDDRIYYYAGNMNRSATQSPTGNTTANAWYSYGIMYNWYTATAGHGSYNSTTTSGPNSDGTMAGDICPAGWHLPTGGSSGEYNALTTAIGGTGGTGATNIRKYPNNFIYSGDYNPKNNYPDGRGQQGRLWQSTASSNANAYRMGYNANSITPVNTYNKWDNFSVRCIYQGGNIPFYNVTVNFAGTGITGVTFENNSYPTETATPSNPTVEIAENVAYTITATTSSGYELSNWATTSTGTLASISANPTTYTITDEATLTVTGTEIPTYTVNVNLGEHVTGISLTNADYGTQSVTTTTGTVTLRRGVEYTLTSSYEAGYTIDAWTTTANGTLGSTTSAATTYTISGTATLSISATEADELSYTLVYDAGLGTDAPDSDTVTSYDSAHDFTITNSAPIYYGYTFTGWTETNGGNTVDYTSGDTLTVTSTGTETTKTLYAVYVANSCPSGKICYYDNGADVTGGGRGTMGDQSASSNSSATLIPSNYSKSGYGFAGWATDANTTPYGPNATITTPDISSTGLALYAKWVKSTGDLQTWSGCGALTLNNITALTDTRDNNTYAVAKLADDNCWLMENLRLDPGTATITNQNTHNPTSAFITESNAGNGASLSVNTMCNSNDSSCFDQIQYNSNSINRSLTQSHTANTNSTAWYSFGTYYNWYTATAGQGTYDTSSNTTVTGDICPKKWRIPTGNSTGEFNALNTAVNSGSTGSDAGLRAYPVNFLWSGDYNNNKRNSSYSNGRIWTATAKDNNTTYRAGFATNTVTASTNAYNKWDGFVVRCIYDLGAIDYYEVVVSLPANVTSISFTNANYGVQTATSSSNTVSLAQGATYTLTATFASGYTLDSWTNGTNSTIGSTTENPTTFSITDDSTLTLSTKEICGVTVGPNAICYDANGNDVEGTMGAQTFDRTDTFANLLASNFSRSGYGFAGWSPDSTVTNSSKIYGPQETITFTAGQYSAAGLRLYAVWVQSAGSMQSDYWNVCKTLTAAPTDGTANLSSVSALTDQRDGETYAIARLADGNCWMIENLRLENTASHNSDGTLAQGYDASFAGLADPEGSSLFDAVTTANTIYSTDGSTSKTISGDNQSYRFPRYNNINTPTNASNRPQNPASNNFADDATTVGMYSYGNYYTWAAAIADTTGYYTSGTNGTSVTNTSICPAGWHLPKGGDKTNESNNELWTLIVKNINNGVNPANYSSSTRPYYSNANEGPDVSRAIRAYPNNFIYSGISGGTVYYRGDFGFYWTSTTQESGYAYYMTFSSNRVHPGTNNYYKFFGGTIRCIVSAPTHSVTISPDSYISRVTFSASGETTQVATSTNPTVSLKEGKSYTITATAATGYELASWSTTSNGTLGSTTTNPTTYTVTDDATLSVASQVIPTYTVTVNMDNNVTGITFANTNYGTQSVTTTGSTVTLRRGVSYTVTASLNDGYIITSWLTAANGTLSSTTNNPTIYTVTGTSTLTLTSEAICGVTAKSDTICYDRNDTIDGTIAGTMGRQPVDSSATSITLLASNFSNSDYGFAGWSTTKINPDSATFRSDLESAIVYGPHEEISFTAGQYSSPNNGLKLYAVWVPVAEDSNNNKLTFQTNDIQKITLSEGGNLKSKSNGYVTALKDQRDGQAYAIAKLADGQYWMIENLRLEAEASTGNNQFDPSITNESLSQGYGDRFTGLPSAQTYWSNSQSGAHYNHQNTSNRAFNPTNNTEALYSYGNYYSWNSAVANSSSVQNQTLTTSICPFGWRLPDYAKESDFNYPADHTAYPMNFTYAGRLYQGSSISGRGSVGSYWTSRASTSSGAFRLFYSNPELSSHGYQVRCIAEPPIYSVTISPDSHISSVKFVGGGTTQTATPSNPTVSLKYGASYSITATVDAGYEFASWSTTASGTLRSTTSNSTIYAISDDATLTVTSRAIPTYTVTVNMDSNVTSIIFTNANYGTQSVTTTGSTVTLRRGISYYVTASFNSGYVVDAWSTGANGTLNSTSANPVTYKVTDDTTLSLTSKEQCSGAVAANSICYVPNGNNVEGTMGVQTFSSTDTSVTLLASNFSRSGYGFAGWSTDSTVTNNSKIYGPQEDFTMTAGQYATTGFKLYAVWVQSAGYLQTDAVTTCSGLTIDPTDGTANLSSVSALTDQRDGETYAIAKLADGNCWMIENLRLESTNSDNSTGALAQGYGTSTSYGNFSGLATAESAYYFSYSTTANSLYYSGTQSGSASINIGTIDYPEYRVPRYNNWNNQTNAIGRPQNPTTNSSVNSSTNAGMYSYGNYYSWAAAIANTSFYYHSTYRDENGRTSETAETSLCPTGWKLPYGSSTGNGSAMGGFSYLDIKLGGTGTTTGSSTTPTGAEVSKAWRKFPNNFVYSGETSQQTVSRRGSEGSYWTSTADYYNYSNSLTLKNETVIPGTTRDDKYVGKTIRCTVSTPTHPVTISPDPHVLNVTFSGVGATQTATPSRPTVYLNEGQSYTITATFATGYEFVSWSTTANGTLGSTTTNPTTYTVTDTTTLSIASRPYLNPSDCPAENICYAPNASDVTGAMSSIGFLSSLPAAGIQAVDMTKSTVGLIAPNYKRQGYGFAGWSTDYEATNASTIYGPNQIISTSDGLDSNGLILYPVWVASTGTIQNWNGCSSLTPAIYDNTTNAIVATLNSVTALTDSRDNNVYTVARLADGNCWTTENLRLGSGVTISSSNSNNPFSAVVLPASSDSWCPYEDYCPNSSAINTNNSNPGGTNASNEALFPSRLDNTTTAQWYAYGNYYTWYSATAESGTVDITSGNAAADICPAGWHLPYGGSGTGTGEGGTSGGYSYLDIQMGGNGWMNYGVDSVNKWMSFPANIVENGLWEGSSPRYRGTAGYYLTASARDATEIKSLEVHDTDSNVKAVRMGEGSNNLIFKTTGAAVRCVLGAPSN